MELRLWKMTTCHPLPIKTPKQQTYKEVTLLDIFLISCSSTCCSASRTWVLIMAAILSTSQWPVAPVPRNPMPSVDPCGHPHPQVNIHWHRHIHGFFLKKSQRSYVWKAYEGKCKLISIKKLKLQQKYGFKNNSSKGYIVGKDSLVLVQVIREHEVSKCKCTLKPFLFWWHFLNMIKLNSWFDHFPLCS